MCQKMMKRMASMRFDYFLSVTGVTNMSFKLLFFNIVTLSHQINKKQNRENNKNNIIKYKGRDSCFFGVTNVTRCFS